MPKGSSLAALCVEGKQKTSEELAAYPDERAGSGAGDVAFVILSLIHIFAIMGESGSGKTTLLNILAALDKPCLLYTSRCV